MIDIFGTNARRTADAMAQAQDAVEEYRNKRQGYSSSQVYNYQQEEDAAQAEAAADTHTDA